MNRLEWWFRAVGIIYVLLGLGFIPALNATRLSLVVPNFDAPVGGVAYRGQLDYSFMFGLDLTVTGAFLVWASSEPFRHLGLVWLVVWLEAIRGIVDDLYMIARWPANTPLFIGFIVLHLAVIVTGTVFTRQASASTQNDAAQQGGQSVAPGARRWVPLRYRRPATSLAPIAREHGHAATVVGLVASA